MATIREKAKITADALADDALAVCQKLLPNGFRDRNIYFAGDIYGSKGDSLKVTLNGIHAGKWKDWANEHHHGDLLQLIKLQQNCNTPRAIEYAKNLASIPEPSPDLAAKRKKKKQEDEAKQQAYNELNKQKAFAIFNNAKPINNSLAERYLLSRGISKQIIRECANLRYEWSCENYQGNGIMHYYPALVARVCDGEGKFLGIQRTFLTQEGKKRSDLIESKKALARTQGGAVYFPAEISDKLILAEGIETALSLKMAFPLTSVAASLSANMMLDYQLPAKYAKLIIARDEGEAGENFALALQSRLIGHGIPATIIKPANGDDFNDDHQKIGLSEMKAHIINQLKRS